MARINDKIKVQIDVDTTELEKAYYLLKNLRSLGIKKRTLNLLVKEVYENKDKVLFTYQEAQVRCTNIEELSPIKVGDKVRIVNPRDGHKFCLALKGMTGVVTEILQHSLKSESSPFFYRVENSEKESDVFRLNEIERIEE